MKTPEEIKEQIIVLLSLLDPYERARLVDRIYRGEQPVRVVPMLVSNYIREKHESE